MLKDGLRSLAAAFAALLFPPVCSFCDSADVDEVLSLCGSCRDALKQLPDRICGQCGRPFSGVTCSPDAICLSCLAHPPWYSRARYAVLYDGVLRDALIRFKFHGALYLSRTLAAILTAAFARHFRSGEFDVVVPVPVHPNRLVERGYNQALILAQRISTTTGIPLDRTCLEKTRDTKPQVGLSRAARVANLRGSFGVRLTGRVAEKRILVIDDVATTGTTIEETAKTLRNAGAKQVDALVLALRSGGPEGARQTSL
jgi:ComF family protein